MVAERAVLAVGDNARRGLAVLLAALGLMLAAAGGASAATFTPNTFADNDAGSDPVDATDCLPSSTDPCSAREAIQSANDTAGDDDVPLLAGRYELNPQQGPLAFGSGQGALLVHGAGARQTTIDGNANVDNLARVVVFNAGSVGELRDLAVTGGYTGESPGAGIRVFDGEGTDATATLTRVWVHGNTANLGNGGGIQNDGQLRIVQSLLSNNVATENGGAINNSDELTVVNSTVSGNEARGTADRAANGGGINSDGARAEFEPSPRGPGLTALSGAIPAGAPYASVDNSTIAANNAPNGNGGGVATAPEGCSSVSAQLGGNCAGPTALALFHNAIVSDNTADGDSNCSGNFPPADPNYGSSQGYNLEDGESCLFTQASDKNAASGLAFLANNGGGTDTHMLKDGSVAIDGGDPSSCQAVDQRGATRPQRSRCDIGAFERESIPVPAQQLAQQTIPQNQPPPIISAACRDGDPPITTLHRSGLTVGSDSVALKGRSRDPNPCPSGVQRVEVSMAKVSGTELNCRFLRRSSRFVISPFRDCRTPILFLADGTNRWSFTFHVKLPPGKYRAQARAYDVRRHKETPKKRRNIVFFEVK
jgi:hypothetical protein